MKHSAKHTMILATLHLAQIHASNLKKENRNYTITNTYTDNIFGASNDNEEIRRRKGKIGKVWEVKDVGETEFFLGMRVQQNLKLGMVQLTQHSYWEHVLN